MTWFRPVIPNGVIIGYQVLLGTTIIYNTTTTQAVVSGLTVSTNYNLSVVAVTAKGSGQQAYIQAATATIRECIVFTSVYIHCVPPNSSSNNHLTPGSLNHFCPTALEHYSWC